MPNMRHAGTNTTATTCVALMRKGFDKGLYRIALGAIFITQYIAILYHAHKAKIERNFFYIMYTLYNFGVFFISDINKQLNKKSICR